MPPAPLFGRKRTLAADSHLTTASQKEGTAYTLTVANVKAKTVAPAVAKDLAGTQVFTGFSTTPVTPAGGALTVSFRAETPAAKTIATKTANNTLLV